MVRVRSATCSPSLDHRPALSRTAQPLSKWSARKRPFRLRSMKRLVLQLFIGMKLVLQVTGLGRQADIYVGFARGWRYPPFLLQALRRCGSPVLEVPSSDVGVMLREDGLWNVLLRTRILRVGAAPTAPVVVASDPDTIAPSCRSPVRLSIDWFSPDARADGIVMPYFPHPSLRVYD